MPTYEYLCEACGHEFEKFQSIKAIAIKICPACKKKRVVRKIGTGAGIIFKGGGFYETDYRSENYKKAAEADKPAEVKTDARAGEAKPAEMKPAETRPAETKPVEAKKPSSKSGSKKKK